MKKFFIPVVLSALLLCGCDIYKTYETYNVYGTNITTYEINTPNDKWKESIVNGEGINGYYVYQQFIFPEITDEVFRKGSVQVYLVETVQAENPKDSYTCKHILPYVYPRDIIEGNDRFQIMQNIRYEVEPGLLTIVVEWQDFYRCDLEDFKFNVCILTPAKIEND